MKSISPIVGLLLLSACSSSPKIHNSAYSWNINKDIYGYLEKGPGGEYMFTKFTIDTTAKKSNYEPWVNLRTMSPAFSTSDYGCATGGILGNAGESMSGKNSFHCDMKKPEKIFRKTTISSGDVVQSTLGNAFLITATFGMGALDAGGHYTSSFDVDLFDDAINQASKNLEDISFRENIEHALSYRREISDKYNRLIDENYNNYTQSLSTEFIDQSKLYNSKFPEDLVRIISPKKKDIPFYGGNFKHPKELLPMLDKYFDERLKNNKFSLECKKHFYEWNISTKGCDQTLPINNKHTSAAFNPVYIIKSKKKDKVNYPINISDNSIVLTSQGANSIELTNQSNGYVLLKSLSMYVNDNIETIKDINIELPPKSVKNLDGKELFKRTQRHLEIENYTKEDLNSTIAIGAAVRYKLVDSGTDKTLYKTNTYVIKDYL